MCCASLRRSDCHYTDVSGTVYTVCWSAVMHRVAHSGSHQWSVYVTCELLSLSSDIALHSWDKHLTQVTWRQCAGRWIIRPWWSAGKTLFVLHLWTHTTQPLRILLYEGVVLVFKLSVGPNVCRWSSSNNWCRLLECQMKESCVLPGHLATM